MAAFLDGCRFNPAAGGTTDWTYSSAVTGYQSPSAANVVNGRLYKYRAESADLSQCLHLLTGFSGACFASSGRAGSRP